MRHAAKRVLRRNVHGQGQIAALAAARASPRGTAHAAHAAAKSLAPIRAEGALAAQDAVEDIAPARTGASRVGIAAGPAGTGHAAKHQQLVVFFALLRVGQGLVRFADLFELRLVAARIRVVFLGELAKRRLNVLVGGVA